MDMATAAQLVSVEEYLAHETKPASEYEDGVVTQKPMATRKHGLTQRRIGQLIDETAPELESVSEVTVQLREGKFLVPDVIAQRRDAIQDPYPTKPVHLCIEILSPSDRLSEALAKCEAYAAWGVAVSWILDPEDRRAWMFHGGNRLQEAEGVLIADGLAIPLEQVFSVLD